VADVTPTSLVAIARKHWEGRVGEGSRTVYAAALRKMLGRELPAGASVADRLEAAVQAFAQGRSSTPSGHRTVLKGALDSWTEAGLLEAGAAERILGRLPG
jgi:hypothetical protein